MGIADVIAKDPSTIPNREVTRTRGNSSSDFQMVPTQCLDCFAAVVEGEWVESEVNNANPRRGPICVLKRVLRQAGGLVGPHSQDQ